MRAVLPLVTTLAFVACSSRSESNPTIAVRRGTLAKLAQATGQIEPDHEAQVNTHLSGYVKTLYVTLGQRVAAGDKLAEVWPVLTEQDRLRAERDLQQAIEGEEAAKEFVNGEHVLSYLTRIMQGPRTVGRMEKAAERGRRSAEESLRLLREGHAEIDGRTIDFVVRAPVAGHVLALSARVGDPVTPASTYGTGTALVTLGDLGAPIFRGTADEIDVGRMKVGMAAKITLGALPGVVLEGTIQEIGLRARRQDNATVFDLRIAVKPSADVVLRSGYSAVAEVELARATDVLVLPERVVADGGGERSVWRKKADGSAERVVVKTGIGNGLDVEIREGLAEGDQVFERAPAR